MDIADVRQDIEVHARRLGRWVGLRAIVTLAFGVLFVARPGTGVGVLVALFAIYAIVDGIAALVAAFTDAAMNNRVAMGLEGGVSIAAGAFALALPASAAVMMLLVVAVRAVVVGVLEVIAAIRLGEAVPNPWLLAISGVISALFGLALMWNPLAGLVTLAWLVGLYGLVYGCAQLAAALALHQTAKQVPPLRPIAHT